MLLLLGDVSARGADLTRSNWSLVIRQFQSILGPILGLPYRVLLGDGDIGDCSNLNSRSVSWIASKFPGLDSSGCAAFRISNVSFVSLNTVALLCGENRLRFSVEKTVETKSIELQMGTEQTKQLMQASKDITLEDFSWRDNALSSGSGPVLLLHMPLHLKTNNLPQSKMYAKIPEFSHQDATVKESRIVFSAHTHEFRDRTHLDGTHEITVPAMSWEAVDDPGFVVTSFKSNRKSVTVRHCLLAKESSVIFTCIFTLVSMILSLLVTHTSIYTNLVS